LCSTPWFPLTQHALTFLSSLSLLFPSLHLLPPPPALRQWSPLYFTQHFHADSKTSTSSSRHTFRRGKQIEADGTTAGCTETCSVWRQQTSTTPIRRVATEGMADQAAPVYKSTTPTKRVATEGMADQAAPVLKSTWPTQAGCHRGRCRPGSPGASRRPGAHHSRPGTSNVPSEDPHTPVWAAHHDHLFCDRIFPITRLEFFRFSSDIHIFFFFFY
jgi:hypothetical protein